MEHPVGVYGTRFPYELSATTVPVGEFVYNNSSSRPRRYVPITQVYIMYSVTWARARGVNLFTAFAANLLCREKEKNNNTRVAQPLGRD